MTITGSPVDLYDALGVPATATTEEITVAFRERAKEMHPDRAVVDDETDAQFKALTQAYSVLVRPDRRAEYDRRRAAARRPTGSRPSTAPASTRPHEPLFRTPGRARAAIWWGVALVVVGLLSAAVLANVSTGDSGESITLWLVVVKLVACGAILWAAGWWRLQRLRTGAPGGGR